MEEMKAYIYYVCGIDYTGDYGCDADYITFSKEKMKEYIEENDIERGFIIEAKEGSLEEGKIIKIKDFLKDSNIIEEKTEKTDELANNISIDDLEITHKSLPNLYDKFVDEVNENMLNNDIDNNDLYSDENFEKWVIQNISPEDLKKEYEKQQTKENKQNNNQIVNDGGNRPKP